MLRDASAIPKYESDAFADGDFKSTTDSEDALYQPQRKRKRSSKPAPPRKKKLKPDSDASKPLINEFDAGNQNHAASSHIIHSGVPIRLALLAWYETVRDVRGMPWRKPYDPSLGPEERAQRAYEVWVSEIMLQQTQVATVIPYYNRWMEKFPTIRELAAANVDEVNALWKGLGYYSRASRLLEGAKTAVADFAGKLPNNARDMQSHIPGIGRYSAGAISSIAYGEEVPVLDGNVHRLLSRFLALHSPPKAKSTLDVLWAAAAAMVEMQSKTITNSEEVSGSGGSAKIEPHHPGDINQALIELGSTVCKVREPICESCPLNTWCAAYQRAFQNEGFTPIVDIEDICKICQPIVGYEGVTSYPMKSDRKKPREEIDIVNVIEWHSSSDLSDRQFLLIRRPEGGLLAGLYEFPTNANVSRNITQVAKDKLAREILSNFTKGGSGSRDLTMVAPKDVGADGNQPDECSIAKIIPVGDVTHVFSHIKKTYSAQWVVLEGGAHPPQLISSPVREEGPKKGSMKGKTRERNANVNLLNGAMWVPLSEVVNTNMGNGVVKVWNLTRKLWEK